MISPSTRHHLSAANGYHELGMIEEAAEELEEIKGEDQSHPDVLRFRTYLNASLHRWEVVEEAARQMVLTEPEEVGWWISWAYATRRKNSIAEANGILLRAEKLHPLEPTIQFNLGCYACQMGDTVTAKSRVAAAIKLDHTFKKVALNDRDLEPLWVQIAELIEG